MIKKLLRKLFYHRTKSLLLCIHHVRSYQNTSDNEITEGELKKIISRKSVISLSDFLDKKNGIVLTFDDGYKDIIDVVYPIMKNKKTPFTIFVNPSTIGEDGYLSLEDLLILSQDKLCTIGSHSYNHINFFSLTDAEIKNELESSLLFFQHHNIICKYFAFPYGQWNEQIKSICLESNTFTCFFGVAKGIIDYKKNLHDSIPQRINVSKEMMNEFK